MRISELATASGVPIATLKFYLREGMLERGTVTAATRAEYGPEHLERVGLIGALTGVRGLPLAKVREILAIIDEPDADLVAAMGHGVAALPPYVETPTVTSERAASTARALGIEFDPEYPASAQLEAAIEGLERAGLAWDDDIARRYWDAVLPLAREELAPVSSMSDREAVAYAVLGTALYEPIILALRRLAHRRLAEDR